MPWTTCFSSKEENTGTKAGEDGPRVLDPPNARDAERRAARATASDELDPLTLLYHQRATGDGANELAPSHGGDDVGR